jgi:DNA-binding NarL/FixJ family response regulator
MINVMLVDDHKMVREGIGRIIEADNKIKVIDEACNGKECIERLRISKPDIILLDINMPDMDGFETFKALNRKKKRPSVIFLTCHNEIEYLIKAVDMGADGYILKESESKELIRGINTVSKGERFVQPSMIPLLNSKLLERDADKEKIESLSDREIMVLKLVAVGNYNKDVADMLNISESTVKNHLNNIYKKIDCIDRTQAAVFCIKNGLISIHD